MVQWLQAYSTITNSPRVWQMSDLKSTHAYDPCIANKTVDGTQMGWQYAFMWMTVNWVTTAAELMTTWLTGSSKNMKVSLRMDQDKWKSAEAESTSITRNDFGLHCSWPNEHINVWLHRQDHQCFW
jgi:hypothetical protein